MDAKPLMEENGQNESQSSKTKRVSQLEKYRINFLWCLVLTLLFISLIYHLKSLASNDYTYQIQSINKYVYLTVEPIELKFQNKTNFRNVSRIDQDVHKLEFTTTANPLSTSPSVNHSNKTLRYILDMNIHVSFVKQKLLQLIDF